MASRTIERDHSGGSQHADETSLTCRVAYLGPPGTYGHQAATAFTSSFVGKAELVPVADIPSIYTYPADFLVMPLQNTIHGVVTETLDAILGSKADSARNKTRPWLIGDLKLPIRHCLVVKKGVQMDQIRWMRSHEQALGQSSRFIKEYLPHAKIRQWPSTAGAAVSLLEETGEEGQGAAICSKAVVGLYPDQLEVLYEGTQGIDNNFTRFLLFSRSERHTPFTRDMPRHPNPSSLFTFSSTLAWQRLISYCPEVLAVHTRPIKLRQQDDEIASALSRSTVISTEQGVWARSPLEERFPLGYLVEVKLGSEAETEGEMEGWCIGHTELRVGVE